MEETERLQQWANVFDRFCLFVCCSVMAIWKQLPVHCSFHLSCVERFRFTALRPPVLTTLVMSCRGIDPSIFGVESLASQYWHLRKIKVLIPDLVSAIQTQIGLRQISFQEISALWNSSFLWSGKSTIMTFQAKAKAFRYHGDQVTWSDMESKSKYSTSMMNSAWACCYVHGRSLHITSHSQMCPKCPGFPVKSYVWFNVTIYSVMKSNMQDNISMQYQNKAYILYPRENT